jgi:hypothetical protein
MLLPARAVIRFNASRIKRSFVARTDVNPRSIAHFYSNHALFWRNALFLTWSLFARVSKTTGITAIISLLLINGIPHFYP